ARRARDGLRIASGLLALLLHDAEEPEELLLVRDTREEAVAVACRAARGQLGVSADDDRNPARLHGLGIRFELAPAEELAVERLGLRLPQRAHRPHRLRRARGALRERDAPSAEVRPLP